MIGSLFPDLHGIFVCLQDLPDIVGSRMSRWPMGGPKRVEFAADIDEIIGVKARVLADG